MENKVLIFKWIDTILKENKYKKVDVMEHIDSYIREMQNTKGQDTEIQEVEKFEYALYQFSEKYVQYILVLDVGKAEIGKMDINNRQRIIYRRLQELGEKMEPEFDKNVSLLLCVNDDIAKENLEKEVLKIEENPYCFKKLVLTYTKEEIENFNSILGENNIWDYMQKCMAELQDGKAEIEDGNIKFVLKLLIKIPFLSVDIEKKEKKKNLLKEIEKQLEEKYKHVWEDIKELDLTKIDEMKSFSEDQIDKILDKWYVEEVKK